jgi:hypothetical protein
VSTENLPCESALRAPLFLSAVGQNYLGVGAMPRFQPLSQERIAELTTRRGPGQVDLSEHKRWIEDALRNANGWGEIGLEPADNVRAIKRRTTIAGKEMNRTIKWHRKSTPTTLIFQAVDPASVTKRTRRSRS